MFALDFLNSIKDGNVRQQFVSLVTQMASWALLEHDEEGRHQSVAPTGTIEVGDIITSGSPVTRTRARLCDGSELNRVKYALLFARYGTTHGVGDGSTTFNIPDYRDRFLIGVGAQSGVLGDTGGDFDHVHTMGSHTHSIGSDGGHTHGGSTSTDGSHAHAQGAHSHALNTIASADAAPNSPFGSVAGQTSQTDIFNDSGTGSAGSHNHSISSDGSHDHGGDTGGASGGSSDAANPPYAAVYYYVYTGVLEE